MTLDVGKVFVGAFLVPYWKRRDFARALAGPLAGLAAVVLLWEFGAARLVAWGFPAWGLWLVACIPYGMLFATFAVACHRLVLLDPRRVRPGWSWREFRFLFWLVGLYLVSMAIVLPVWTVIINAVSAIPNLLDAGNVQWDHWTRQLAMLPALYVVARLSLVLPAVALDGEVSLRWAWKLTRGNGWRMVAVVGILPWAISEILGLLYRAEPSAVETAALTVIGIALFAVQIAALSISYRELVKENAA